MTSDSVFDTPHPKIKSALLSLLVELRLKYANYCYRGGKPNPQTGERIVTSIAMLGRPLKLQLIHILGDDGFITHVDWMPNFHLRQTASDGIEFANGTRIFAVGLTGTRFQPNPGREQYIFDSEEALIDHVLAKATEWFELAGVKTHLGE